MRVTRVSGLRTMLSWTARGEMINVYGYAYIAMQFPYWISDSVAGTTNL